MNIKHDIKNVGCIAIYEPSDPTHARVTMLISDITDNKLVDRVEFPNLDFSNDDEMDEALTKIKAMLDKHDAMPIPLDQFIPNHNCPKCKQKMDCGLFCTNPGDDEPEAILTYACWHCKTWLKSDEAANVELRAIHPTFGKLPAAELCVAIRVALSFPGVLKIVITQRWADAFATYDVKTAVKPTVKQPVIRKDCDPKGSSRCLGSKEPYEAGTCIREDADRDLSDRSVLQCSETLNSGKKSNASDENWGVFLAIDGSVSRTEGGALVALAALEMEKAIVNGGEGSGDVKTISGRRVGEWSVRLGAKK